MMAGTVKPTKEQVTVSQYIKHSANITMGLCTAAYQLQGKKEVEAALTPVHEKVIAVKKSISGLVGKMETGGDQLNW